MRPALLPPSSPLARIRVHLICHVCIQDERVEWKICIVFAIVIHVVFLFPFVGGNRVAYVYKHCTSKTKPPA